MRVRKTNKSYRRPNNGIKRKAVPLPYNRCKLAQWAINDVKVAFQLINNGKRHCGMQILNSLETRNGKLNHYHRKYVVCQQSHPSYNSDIDDQNDDDKDKVKTKDPSILQHHSFLQLH